MLTKINKKFTILQSLLFIFMISCLLTSCFQGIEAVPVQVQVQVVPGLPTLLIVGLPGQAVKESKDRIRSALYSLGIGIPAKRITMNLSPADMVKEGNHYDLPLVIGLLMALDILPQDIHPLALGELGLDASIQPVQGVLSAGVLAHKLHKTLICPASCGAEARWAGDVEILAPFHLLELINHFKGTHALSMPTAQAEEWVPFQKDFSDVHGQEAAKLALCIAASGGHNVLMSGPPGTGKSMLAERMLSLMGPLSPLESLQATMIQSLARRPGSTSQAPIKLMRNRPFRSPHHFTSVPALVGGGLKGSPGEISMAHGGILFLDEFPEFSRSALESLRQSLETRQAVVARANYRAVYPANYQLIAAMNPCKCGYLGKKGKECTKAPACGALYLQNLSGPLMDRIDLFVEVPDISFQNMTKKEGSESASYRKKVEKAIATQEQRYQGMDFYRNAQAPSAMLDQELEHQPETKTFLSKAAEKFDLSVRGYYRTLQVARTIADLEQTEALSKDHISCALSYRPWKYT